MSRSLFARKTPKTAARPLNAMPAEEIEAPIPAVSKQAGKLRAQQLRQVRRDKRYGAYSC